MVFDSREDVLREALHGDFRRYLVAFECPDCGRLHVHVFTLLLTPFSDPASISVPDGVLLDVTNWGGSAERRIPPMVCPTNGVEMRRLTPPLRPGP